MGGGIFSKGHSLYLPTCLMKMKKQNIVLFEYIHEHIGKRIQCFLISVQQQIHHCQE